MVYIGVYKIMLHTSSYIYVYILCIYIYIYIYIIYIYIKCRNHCLALVLNAYIVNSCGWNNWFFVIGSLESISFQHQERYVLNEMKTLYSAKTLNVMKTAVARKISYHRWIIGWHHNKRTHGKTYWTTQSNAWWWWWWWVSIISTCQPFKGYFPIFP